MDVTKVADRGGSVSAKQMELTGVGIAVIARARALTEERLFLA
ncbi:MAG: hypothetical protein ACREB9_05640 [Thermoplasmata archaeon]